MQLCQCNHLLRPGRLGDRIPVRTRLYAHVQSGPGTYSDSCKIGTRSLYRGLNPGRGFGHLPLSIAEVKERVVITLLSLWAIMDYSMVKFTSTCSIFPGTVASYWPGRTIYCYWQLFLGLLLRCLDISSSLIYSQHFSLIFCLFCLATNHRLLSFGSFDHVF